MKLHHIGIVVNNIKQSLGELEKYLSFDTTSAIMPVGSQNVNVCLLRIGEPYMELIEPTVSDSPIGEFAKSGGGIHHLCYEVRDIENELESFSRKGATILVRPTKGFDDRRIAFMDLNIKNTRCGLVELLEIK
jgi:methylmalonyl-CoA/ethylmalonyl-CoA epimerase